VACCGVRNAQSGGLAPRKGRTYAWGDAAPDASLANGGLRRGVLLPVDALPAGASEWGCHQMIGNVWEWTATTFYPFPGYVVDYPYREQSAPWFGFTKVARGGCFATPDFVLRGEYRSFYDPAARRELAVGFRTCALDDDEAAAAVAEAAAAARGGGDGRVCRRGDGSCDEFC
jgi:iron(II)-dependent oxidoreductase